MHTWIIEAWKNSIVIKGRYVKPEVLSKIKEKFSKKVYIYFTIILQIQKLYIHHTYLDVRGM